MEINPQVYEILKEFKIDKSQGLLCLLGFYHNLNVETTCTEDVIKGINLTKIIEKDYTTGKIQWNIPLYAGQETAFGWVKEWIVPFGKINSERLGSWRDATTRMQTFFQKYPEYRKDDVYKARDLYLSSIKDARFVMHSHKFIFDGSGAMKKSTLLGYCEKVTGGTTTNHQKGKVLQ